MRIKTSPPFCRSTAPLYLNGQEVVVDALAEVQKGDGHEYLEKIINVPFEVSLMTGNELKKLNEIFANVNKESFNQNHWDEIYHSDYTFSFL